MSSDHRKSDPASRRWLPLSSAGYLLLGIPVILVGLAVLPRFDGLYGQDPYAYFDYATGPLIDNVMAFQSLPPFFWPPGYPLLVGLLSRIVGRIPLAGQLVSLAAGALVPVFTALLARELWMSKALTGLSPRSMNRPPNPRKSGPTELASSASLLKPATRPLSKIFLSPPVMAGLLVACVGQLWQSSVVVMADTTGLAAATLGMWALARYGQRDDGQLAWLALATTAMSYAVLTRWTYALVAIPCTVYAVFVLAQHRRSEALRHAILAGLIVGAVLWPVLEPALSVVFVSPTEDAAFVGDLQVYSWHPMNALNRTFETADGFLSYRLPNGIYYLLAPAHHYYFRPLLALMLLPGLWAVLRRRSTARMLLLLGWAAIVYGFHAGAPWQNFRFTLAYLPPLAIVTAIGVETMIQVVKVRFRWIGGLVLIVGLAWMAQGGWALTRYFIERKDADLTTVTWAQNHAEPGARLLTFNLTLTFEHYSWLETFELFHLNPDEIAELLSDGRPTYVLIDVENVETQWQARPPSENYHWLQTNPGLIVLGQHRNYTLFHTGTVE